MQKPSWEEDEKDEGCYLNERIEAGYSFGYFVSCAEVSFLFSLTWISFVVEKEWRLASPGKASALRIDSVV